MVLLNEELIYRIETCLENYQRTRQPSGIILNTGLIQSLSHSPNFTTPKTPRDFRNSDILAIDGSTLKVIPLEEIPKDYLEIITSQRQGMRIPLSFFQEGWFRSFKGIASYDISATTSDLAQAV